MIRGKGFSENIACVTGSGKEKKVASGRKLESVLLATFFSAAAILLAGFVYAMVLNEREIRFRQVFGFQISTPGFFSSALSSEESALLQPIVDAKFKELDAQYLAALAGGGGAEEAKKILAARDAARAVGFKVPPFPLGKSENKGSSQ